MKLINDCPAISKATYSYAASAAIGIQENLKDYRGKRGEKGIISAAFLLIWIMDLRGKWAANRSAAKPDKPLRCGGC
ncbi:hypothetical protein [Raoultella terrigena]|uniref:hypothetical protein n=1 Tax=Raoultella terrigena TaxID=577 RepID=UPI003BAB128C